jgi:hypothetical protein
MTLAIAGEPAGSSRVATPIIASAIPSAGGKNLISRLCWTHAGSQTPARGRNGRVAVEPKDDTDPQLAPRDDSATRARANISTGPQRRARGKGRASAVTIAPKSESYGTGPRVTLG